MFDDLIAAAASTFLVPDSWIRAVIDVESSWNPAAHNASDPGGGAFGLMQLLVATAQALGYSGDPQGLFDPETNINLGTKLLGELRARFGDDFQAVYSAYNSGDPTKYLTSSQVAANVARAVAALQKWVTAEVGGLVQAGTTGTDGGLVPLVVLVLMFAWAHHKKR